MSGWTFDSRSPAGIALVYAVVSGAYILLSDRLVATLLEDPALTADVQTAKGWLFVAASAVLLFWLVSRAQRELEATNDRLDTALQQTSILHRILRHNLRNSCNVISGNTELLRARTDGGTVPEDEARERLDTIRNQTDQLLTITEKTRMLRDLVMEEQPAEEIDLAALLRNRIDAAREQYPAAELRTTLPETLVCETDPKLGLGIDELLENAVEHSDRDQPTVNVELRRLPSGSILLDVADDGPGMPDIERAVLEEGMESPMFHSEGLGLWIARTVVVVRADGEIDIVDNEPRGTVVRIVLP